MDSDRTNDARARLEGEKVAVERQLLDHGVELEGDENISIGNHEGFADSAQVTAERSQEIGLVEQLRERRAQVLLALQKIETGGYGLCEGCGQEIPAERLEAVPAASLCVSCKQRAS